MESYTQLLQLLVAGLTTGSIYAIVAVGFNIIFKSTDAINFAQGEWVMMGGMIAATAYATGMMPLWACCVAAVVLVALIGGLSERLVIRPLRSPAALLVTLLTIGLAIFSKSLVMVGLGKTPMGYPAFSGDSPVSVAGMQIMPQSFWVIGLALAFMALMHWFFEYTLMGKSLRATAVDRDAAALAGIDVRRTIMLAFVLAAMAGGVAGVIITPLTLTSYDHGTMLGFKGFSAAMLGGLGSLQGAMLGGLLLGLFEALGAGVVSSQFKDAVSFILLLLVLFFRPQGLLGKAEINKV
ncbi:branched-chain amino acid ABC transporter permease [Pusillimonas noertemannii]|uniref:branched-chain amino acid ABC transporter permease n=1 Tax=Pusillimonas noertemannii TaxID=305977 RepID=UPI003340EF7A